MAKPTGAGDMDRRVRFDKRSDVADPAGGTMSDWVPQFTRVAKIAPSMGGEGVMAQRLQGTQPVLIFVRYDTKTVLIEPSWRAVELRNTEEVKTYALKTAEDMEQDRTFITMLGVSGDADA